MEPGTDKDGGWHSRDGEDAFGGQRALLEQPASRWPQAPGQTGDDTVDAVLDRLQEVPQLPTAAHAEAYTGVHDQLLAELDAGGGPD